MCLSGTRHSLVYAIIARLTSRTSCFLYCGSLYCNRPRFAGRCITYKLPFHQRMSLWYVSKKGNSWFPSTVGLEQTWGWPLGHPLLKAIWFHLGANPSKLSCASSLIPRSCLYCRSGIFVIRGKSDTGLDTLGLTRKGSNGEGAMDAKLELIVNYNMWVH